MKILFLITGLGNGGAEMETVNLAIGLKKRGVDVAFISVMKPVGFVDDISTSGMRFYPLNLKKKSNLVFNVSKVFKILNDEKPDIIHAQMYHANIFSRIIRLVSPMNYHLINSIQNNFEGGSLRKLAYKLTKNIPDLVSHVSKIGLENYINSGLIKPSTSVFIPNSVNLAQYHNAHPFNFRKSFNLANDVFVFLAVARLEKQKDYPSLFEAVDALRKKSDKKFAVFIAGAGSLDSEMKDLVKRMALDDYIFFLGLRKDVPMLMKGADCFVMSSQWEGTSLSLLEAMGAGLPTVVTTAGDNSVIVQENINGHISPINNPEKLAENMYKILETPHDILVNMGVQSRAIASRDFDREAIITQWFNVYQRLIDNGSL